MNKILFLQFHIVINRLTSNLIELWHSATASSAFELVNDSDEFVSDL